MPKNKPLFSIEIPEVLAWGIGAGVSAAIAKLVGFSIDEEGKAMFFLEKVCELTQEGLPFNCWKLIVILSMISFGITIYAIWKEIKKSKY